MLARAKTRRPAMQGLQRERLMLILGQSIDHRVTLVLAPAGAGKTTALDHFTSSLDARIAWYRAEPTDGQGSLMLAYIAQSIASAVGRPVPSDHGVLGLVEALESWTGPLIYLVVDDIQALEGSDAERELERLITLAPHCLRILVAGRRTSMLNVPRLRLEGDLLELDTGDLRFRSWEVEQLFGSIYREPLPPEDLAKLSRRTEGWAAGLQLFHLATTGKPWATRRQAVASLGAESRLVRGYLTQNVLDDLPTDLRSFLIETSVLGRLTPDLCDGLPRSGR